MLASVQLIINIAVTCIFQGSRDSSHNQLIIALSRDGAFKNKMVITVQRLHLLNICQYF